MHRQTVRSSYPPVTPPPTHTPLQPPSHTSSSLHQSHLIVFPLEVLYINN